MMHQHAFFAGQWQDASGSLYETHDPHDGRVVSQLHAATEHDVDIAVRYAAQAFAQSSWQTLLPHQRAKWLYRISDGIEAEAEALARQQRLDNGKPIQECRALVASAAATFRYFGACAEVWEMAITPPRGDYLSMALYEPLGVVGAITPWNSPIASEAQKIAPALAAGCAMVIKPAELTPNMALALARIAQQAGLPDGLLSVLPGKGRIVGDALVKHPLIRRIAFTGGTEVGLNLARLAATKLMPITLELGGKSPTIVCPDADLDKAVAGIAYGIFSSSGQSCVAGSRAFIHRSVYAECRDRLIAIAKQLRVGHPDEETTQMGPLITHAHRAGIEHAIQQALDQGATLCCGGRPTDAHLAQGAYLRPTILEGASNDSPLCQEELFGPVLALLPWDNEDDLIKACHHNPYGLACGIWTEDSRRAWRLARAIQAGTVWINTYKQFSISTPFTGAKQSGFGIEKGWQSMQSYCQQKSVYWGMSGASQWIL